MSPPDPRTEVAMECADRIAEAFIRNGTTRGECRQIARDALTTEAARVRGETWREAAKYAVGVERDKWMGLKQTNVVNVALAMAKYCEDQANKAVVKDSLTTEIDTLKPSPWSTARPTVEGGSTND